VALNNSVDASAARRARAGVFELLQIGVEKGEHSPALHAAGLRAERLIDLGNSGAIPGGRKPKGGIVFAHIKPAIAAVKEVVQ
jgi:hypothetical protein